MNVDTGALGVSALVLACLLVGTYAGMYGARWLKEHHLSRQTQDAVKLGAGMVAAMASLILGLMTASVKDTFDSVNRDLRSYAVDLVLLDADLRDMGPPSAPARQALLTYIHQVMSETWPEDPNVKPQLDGAGSHAMMEQLGRAIRALPRADDEQTRLRGEAEERFETLRRLRWTVTEESSGYVPTVFIVVLVIWLTIVFASFGLFAPTNQVAVIALFLCAFSMAGAIFIILEMSGPFNGIVKVSSAPFDQVLERISAP